MTGTWEQRLLNLAEGGVPWDLPTRFELASALNSLKQVLQAAAENPGLAGQSGDAARTRFTDFASEIDEQIRYLQDHVPDRLEQANEVRRQARDAAATLPAGQMNPGQEALVRGAATGATLMFGPVAFLAGEGASRAVNGYMASQREAAAREAVRTHSDRLDAVEVSPVPSFGKFSVKSGTPTPAPSPSGFPGGGSGSGGGRSFESYPDWDLSGGGTGPGDGGVSTPPPGHADAPPTPGDYGPFPGGVPGQPPGAQPPIDIGNVPDDPTPDGPISGSPTLPGGAPTLPGGIPLAPGGGGGGGGLVGAPGGPGAGIGSGLGAGLIAGGGGALALGRVGGGGLPGAPGGRLFGGPAGGSAGVGGARSGG
ncbi:MAG: hypothetical protein ACK4LS_13295, partial [Microbacterium sp.]